MTNEERQRQVLEQCRCVAALARAIAEIHEQLSKHVDANIVDIVGKRTARIMEYLGDELNNMDAATPEDSVWDSTFTNAHLLYPA